MFIRKRQVKARNGKTYTYHSIVESVRVDGRVRQKVLYDMGSWTFKNCLRREQRALRMWAEEKLPARIRTYQKLGGLPQSLPTAEEFAHKRAEIQSRIDLLERVRRRIRRNGKFEDL